MGWLAGCYFIENLSTLMSLKLGKVFMHLRWLFHCADVLVWFSFSVRSGELKSKTCPYHNVALYAHSVIYIVIRQSLSDGITEISNERKGKKRNENKKRNNVSQWNIISTAGRKIRWAEKFCFHFTSFCFYYNLFILYIRCFDVT